MFSNKNLDTNTPEQISQTIVQHVASESETDAIELQPLYEVIDPDALDAIVNSYSSSDSSMTFTYNDYTVTVDADGAVNLEP
jgi:hypothetical protein